MKSFLRVSALILIFAGAVYGYEFATQPETPPSRSEHIVASRAEPRTPISRTKTPRIRSDRTVNLDEGLPARPAQLERMVSEAGGSDFPILMPLSAVRDKAAADQHKVRMKLTDNGYSAVVVMEDMDVVIYGTRTVFRRKGEVEAELKEVKAEIDQIRKSANDTTAATGQVTRKLPPMDPKTGAPLARIRPPYMQPFEEIGEGRGGSLSFGRYGVDYHIEFYCHPVGPDPEAGANCVDETRARAMVAEMDRGGAVK